MLDATTGQNGLIQAKQFQEISGCTGIVLTKLDGTAKGGIVIAIAQELQVPVKFVGLGEDIKDLQPFLRPAARYEDAALGKVYKVRGHCDRTQFVLFSAVNSRHFSVSPR